MNAEDRAKLKELMKLRYMVLANDKRLEKKKINQYQHDKKNKEIMDLINEYEKRFN